MRTLESQEKGVGGEIQLTDAMARKIGGQPFHAVKFAGRRFDRGSKAGFIEATLSLALGARHHAASAGVTAGTALRLIVGQRLIAAAQKSFDRSLQSGDNALAILHGFAQSEGGRSVQAYAF